MEDNAAYLLPLALCGPCTHLASTHRHTPRWAFPTPPALTALQRRASPALSPAPQPAIASRDTKGQRCSGSIRSPSAIDRGSTPFRAARESPQPRPPLAAVWLPHLKERDYRAADPGSAYHA